MSKDLKLEEMDWTLAAFSREMWKELKANRRKGDRAGWLACHPMQLVMEVFHHAAKLHAAVLELKKLPSSEAGYTRSHFRDLVREYAADTANMAMMVADSVGVLNVPGTLPSSEKKLNTEWSKRAVGHKRG
jgi:hypothetical protein